MYRFFSALPEFPWFDRFFHSNKTQEDGAHLTMPRQTRAISEYFSKVFFSSICAIAFSISTAFAEVPVSMTGPVPAITTSYAIGTATTVLYTITNNVPNLSFPISIDGLSAPLSRVTVANDCGNSLPTGPSTCNIGIQIAPAAVNAGMQINQTLSIDYQGRVPLTSLIAFSVPQTQTRSGVLTAVGLSGFIPASSPLLLTSTDAGTTWLNTTYASQIVGGLFNSTSCTGVDPNVICSAAGVAFGGGAYLAITRNSSSSWNAATIPGIPNDSIFYSTSCTGEGTEAVCVAAGKSIGLMDTPLLAVSSDGGQTWTIKNPLNVSNGEYDSVSCFGNGPTSICTAVGTQLGLAAPIIVLSTDGGVTWTTQNIVGATTNTRLSSVSCTGNQGAPFCTVAGYKGTGPFIAISSNNLTAWNEVPIANLATPEGTLSTVSCTGSNTVAICSAGGRYNSGTIQRPLLVVSRDGGLTWTATDITGLGNDFGTFNASSCTEMANDVVCTMVGGLNNLTPLLAVSNNGTLTWSLQPVAQTPNQAIYFGTVCTPVGQSATCTAVGADLTIPQRAPLLAISKDAGLTWSKVTLSNIPFGQLNAASGANVR